MTTYRAWYLSLTAFLLIAGPRPAHAQKEAPVKLIYAVWKDTTGAERAVKHMSTEAKDKIEAYAVLIKDTAGTVEPRLRHHKAHSATGLQASQTLDSAIARLSAPPGDTASMKNSRLSEEDLNKVVSMFNPGESVLLLLSPEPAVADIKHALGMGAMGHPEVVELKVK